MKFEDVFFEVTCAHCGNSIEFFKSDLKRACSRCGQDTLNPKNDLSCAAWCKSPKTCLDSRGTTSTEPET